ncbi:MAG: hypothetical protein KGM97_04450 [Alphaproteobacteria bacterium]|nr:hypothetical protein [Alphaproteobacteria bacterium]MDE2630224.1 hypothetical protein [Alphaproteobacteria bacterium]
MTIADVASDKLNGPRNPYCKATDAKATGQTLGADLACTGKVNGPDHEVHRNRR